MSVEPYAADKRVLTEMTEAERRCHARSMIWLPRHSGETSLAAIHFTIRRDLAVAELERRGIDVAIVRAEAAR